MIKAELLDIVEVGNILGEGVQWNAESQTVWWTDIEGCQLYSYDPEKKNLRTWEVPEKLCSFGFIKNQDSLMAAFESGFAIYQPENGAINWLCKIEQGSNNIRLNDGRVDRQGRFWAGSMMETNQQDPGQGKLYCLDSNGLAEVRERGILISNGLCWSPDATRMYFADSPRREIYAYDFCADSGIASNKVVFAETPDNIFPDGSTVDAEGFIWNAQWNGSRLVRYSPQGEVNFVLDVPALQPSCVAFGGPDLDMLFVTTARQGLNNEQLIQDNNAGHLLIYKTNVIGLEENKYLCSQTS